MKKCVAISFFLTLFGILALNCPVQAEDVYAKRGIFIYQGTFVSHDSGFPEHSEDPCDELKEEWNTVMDAQEAVKIHKKIKVCEALEARAEVEQEESQALIDEFQTQRQQQLLFSYLKAYGMISCTNEYNTCRATSVDSDCEEQYQICLDNLEENLENFGS